MMDRTQDYVVHSLELHLFFARIMKEHAYFLKAGFLPPNGDLAKEAEWFLRSFESLLSRSIALSEHVARCCVVESGELFTEFTDRAECQTQRFTGIAINRGLTAREKRLTCCGCDAEPCLSPALLRQVRQLNRDGLRLADGLISFKEQLLRSVNACCLATANYPLLLAHILREARHYRAHLTALEEGDSCRCQEINNEELFWNQIMMEHALFIRGLLDPSEDALIDTAGEFAADYKRLLENASAANDKTMRCGNVLALTQKFRDFKQAGVEGIEACRIRSIILPLLADHVLREANHYIRLLEA